MSPRKHEVRLEDDQRQQLQKFLESPEESAKLTRRCRIMLLAERGETDKEIAKSIGCSINCVANLRKRFATNGFERALYDAPRSGAPTKFTDEQLEAVVALANETPPGGIKTWTLDKLCKEAVSRGIVGSISIGKMHQLLKSRNHSNGVEEGTTA